MGNKKENGMILQKRDIDHSCTTRFQAKGAKPNQRRALFPPNVDNPGNWSEYTFRPKKVCKEGQRRGVGPSLGGTICDIRPCVTRMIQPEIIKKPPFRSTYFPTKQVVGTPNVRQNLQIHQEV
jgi:hypothetical protein